MNPFEVLCVMQIKTLLRIIFWNSSSRISSVHTYNTRASTSEHFILKNLDSMSDEMLSRVLGSKFGVGYLKFLKKDRKKLLKDH